ncbi:MAG: ABC transporter permease [Gammaproteobacteria bacterium]|nr:ABC transporter permease [Gammaproteobacteria bacterium]
MPLRQHLVTLLHYRHALLLMLRRDIQQRVIGSAFGLLWLIIQPLFLLVVYSVVFGFLLKVRFGAEEDTLAFSLYLMAGLLPFIAFQESLQRAGTTLADNHGLIDRSNFPPLLLPIMAVLTSITAELLGLIILIFAVWIIRGTLSPWLLLLPLLIGVRLLLSFALASFISVLTPFLRDLNQVIAMLLTLLFFATPIIYPSSLIPADWQWVAMLNPFYYLVESYRNVIIIGKPPLPGFYLLAAGSLLVSLVGLWFFNKAITRAKAFL